MRWFILSLVCFIGTCGALFSHATAVMWFYLGASIVSFCVFVYKMENTPEAKAERAERARLANPSER